MKHFVFLILCACALQAQNLPNPIRAGGAVVHNPTPSDYATLGTFTTNVSATQVVTNWPENLEAKRAAVTNYLALVNEAGVLGLGEEGADAKLDADFKNGSQAQKNDALRVSIKLLRAKLALERLGVDPLSASAALAPNVVTNPARVEVEWRAKP